MSVKNFRKANPQGTYPKRSLKAPLMAKPDPEPKPTTARGRRRSENTPEYTANLDARRQMSSPALPNSSRGVKSGPQKGPNKRPKGISNDNFKAYMEGRVTSLR